MMTVCLNLYTLLRLKNVRQDTTFIGFYYRACTKMTGF